MSKVCITRQQVKDFTYGACLSNGLSQEFFEEFWKRMLTRDDIYEEYVWYLVKKEL